MNKKLLIQGFTFKWKKYISKKLANIYLKFLNILKKKKKKKIRFFSCPIKIFFILYK